MALRIFRSFLSTVTPFRPGKIAANFKVLQDPTTGAPVGLQSENANGPDGIWGFIDVTPAQVAAPTAAMIADLNATYRLNAAPWTRYQSNGTQLVQIGATAGGQIDLIPATGVFGNMVIYAPFTVDAVALPEGVVIQGNVHVINFAA